MTRRSITHMSSAAAIALWAGAATAGGVAPGETIQNSFSMSYESGGDRIAIDNADSAETLVHQRVAFTLVPTLVNDLEVEPGAKGEALTFELTNTGNATTEFDINSFIETRAGVEIGLTRGAADAAGTWRMVTADPADAQNTTSPYEPDGTNTISLAPDETVIVSILANIPDVDDGKREDFLLVARAISGGAHMQEGPSGNGYDIFLADDNRDNFESGDSAYLVSAPILTASKSVGLVDSRPTQGFDCALDGTAAADGAFIPGACIEYLITVSNDASASKSAHNLTIADSLPGGVTFSGVINEGFSSITTNAPLIEGDVIELLPGETARMRIRATVD